MKIEMDYCVDCVVKKLGEMMLTAMFLDEERGKGFKVDGSKIEEDKECEGRCGKKAVFHLKIDSEKVLDMDVPPLSVTWPVTIIPSTTSAPTTWSWTVNWV
jgi:hypothetical protein